MIYVLDCTGSMNGYNGAPNIWESTKNFLKSELVKEAHENPKSKVTILPFQQKVLHPIEVNLNSINWTALENVLDTYVKQVTGTNICDSWLAAEKYIDQSRENYIVLMTDGHDNIKGTELLGKILTEFCGKYKNTKGFYVELTKAASLPQGIQNSIDICADLYKIDATNGIPAFGCVSPDYININTRDLPCDITLGFSNSGTFTATLNTDMNPFVTVSIKGNTFSQGRIILHIESKFGDNIETLNKAISAPNYKLDCLLNSDEVIIANPCLSINLNTKSLRTLELLNDETKAERIKPFLWITGKPIDTLRWNIKPKFNEIASSDNSAVMYKVNSNMDLSKFNMMFDESPIESDSVIVITPSSKGVLEILVPHSERDFDVNLTLKEINSNNLDRLNGEKPDNSSLQLKGAVKTKMSIVEIIFWCLVSAIIVFLILWFVFIRNQVYPQFKKGIISIQSPYFATLRVKGYRMVVMAPVKKKQSLIDKIWKGKILYHANPYWTEEVKITPSGKNMRFQPSSSSLVCNPQSVLMRGMYYTITNSNNPSHKIEININ